MIGIATAICATSLVCLAFAATRWIALVCLTVLIYFYPLALLPVVVLLAGAFFLLTHFR